MPLSVGDKLGPYEILSPIGAGGMGEVYRAKDTKLDREVALKVLPEALTHDPERLARFEREAKVLASLNHPNIVTIYEINADKGESFIAMEYVRGRQLYQTLLERRLTISEVFQFAVQIGDALAKAHAAGIVPQTPAEQEAM